MTPGRKIALMQQVMGASHLFCSAVNELLERLLVESSGGQIAMSQVKLLLLISRPEHRFKVTDIADFLGVTNAAASRAVERLVQRGLVERTISREDRRAVDLALTPMSRDLLERYTEARNDELLRLAGDYPEDKLDRIRELLDELSVLLLDVDAAENERCLRCGMHFRSGCVLHEVLGRDCVLTGVGTGSERAATAGTAAPEPKRSRP